MRSLDTNITLRLLLQDVPDQLSKVVDLIDNSKSGSLQVADAVFFECVWILSGKMYNFERELIGKLLLQIADIPQINCNRVMLEKAVPLYVNHSSISFIDACLTVYAELNSAIPLFTFDRKLATTLPKTVAIL
ncbi:MAG TPA: PIN domain-containing protein [Candidatus Saccharimonadales bacterium]|nr:PIN domain-containing protein [Candidatus Saccharimonadales bacterium]